VTTNTKFLLLVVGMAIAAVATVLVMALMRG
jgi:hypothetical protein